MQISRTLARGTAAAVASLALVAGGAAVTSADAAPKPCKGNSCDTGWFKKDTGWYKKTSGVHKANFKKDTGWFKRDTGWFRVSPRDTGW